MSKLRAVWRWSTAGLFSYLSWFLVNLILALLFPLLWSIRKLGGKALVRHFAVRFLRLYFIYVLPVFGLYQVNRRSALVGLNAITEGLVVANHTSWLDALIIIALVPGVRPLVSTRYGKVPLVSHVMQWLGCIFVDRRDRGSVTRAIAKIRESVRKGPVAVFPEGTRSAVGHLKRFQDVFFSVAVDEKCKVEPVLLLFDIPFLGPGVENLVTPRAARLTISKLDTIIPERGEKGQDLAFRTRRAMRKAIGKLAV